MILSDQDILFRCRVSPPSSLPSAADWKPMIWPFESRQVRNAPDEKKIISYGLSSYGYDIRVANEFKIFHNVHSTRVDPKNFDPKNFFDLVSDDPVIIPPNSFALCRSMETLAIPRDVLAICLGKSTYARCGIVVNVTPLEPEWRGEITIEISNTTPNPALIYPNEGICQLIFMSHPTGCMVSYADRQGKYQNQYGVTPAKT